MHIQRALLLFPSYTRNASFPQLHLNPPGSSFLISPTCVPSFEVTQKRKPVRHHCTTQTTRPHRAWYFRSAENQVEVQMLSFQSTRASGGSSPLLSRTDNPLEYDIDPTISFPQRLPVVFLNNTRASEASCENGEFKMSYRSSQMSYANQLLGPRLITIVENGVSRWG
ncbi:hypothetical protein BDR06DRAFT_732502 [Suillus hirtellus]|nr:hypothetical protein BDR06DRAFT_732502 [Suillus hirtellus]